MVIEMAKNVKRVETVLSLSSSMPLKYWHHWKLILVPFLVNADNIRNGLWDYIGKPQTMILFKPLNNGLQLT